MNKVLFTQYFVLNEHAHILKDCETIIPREIPGKFSAAEIAEKISEAAALICTPSFMCDKSVINAAKKLKAIGTVSVGFDHIDIDAASKKKIAVINSPHAVTESTAELAFALILDVTRSISRYDRALRKNLSWKETPPTKRDMLLSGKTLGIIGFGRIGQNVAKKALAFGMNIIYHGRHRVDSDIEQEHKAAWMPLDKVLSLSDIVSLHIPYTPENHHLINAEKLALMRPSACLINTARGSVIDEKALIEALRKGIIQGAGLDVYENEPHIPQTLAELENVVLTPHIGTDIFEVRQHMLGETLCGIRELLDGKKPKNQIN